jgi:hypothetical protein
MEEMMKEMMEEMMKEMMKEMMEEMMEEKNKTRGPDRGGSSPVRRLRRRPPAKPRAGRVSRRSAETRKSAGAPLGGPREPVLRTACASAGRRRLRRGEEIRRGRSPPFGGAPWKKKNPHECNVL